MVISVNLTKKSWVKNYVKKNSIHVVGYIENQEVICDICDSNIDEQKFSQILKENMNGFFSIIIRKDNQLYAAVDHIRSHPLFYAQDEYNFFISDSAEWVRDQINDLCIDPIAREEFQLSGYITGNETLYPNVKQIQAGEYLIFSKDKFIIKEYYSFEHSEPKTYDEKSLKHQLKIVAEKAVSNLINYAQGRQIVVPLSGGYDSRLIVTLLKKLKYENIITFTYGIKGSKEADYSKLVANSLGLEWHFIEYSKEIWSEWSKSKDNIDYQLYCSNLSSLPHLQDCIAVKNLKAKGIIDDKAIFVPGHSGDMVAGSHIPNFIHNNLKNIYSKEDLINHLFEKHYNLKKTTIENSKIHINKISRFIKNKEFYNAYEFSNECENFNWKNRQSKFICNSVRLYEFYGYDWWLPLWDKSIVDFFENLPLPLRNHKWYVSYISDLFESESNIRKMNNSSDHGYFFNYIKKIVNKLGFYQIAKKIYAKFFFVDQFGWYGQFCNLREIKVKNYTYNGLVAYFFIKILDSRINEK